MNTNVKVIIAALSIALVGAVGTAAYFAGSANSAKAEAPAITASEPVAVAASVPVSASEPVVASEPVKVEAPKPVSFRIKGRGPGIPSIATQEKRSYMDDYIPLAVKPADVEDYKYTCIEYRNSMSALGEQVCTSYLGFDHYKDYCRHVGYASPAGFLKEACVSVLREEFGPNVHISKLRTRIKSLYGVEIKDDRDVHFFSSACMNGNAALENEFFIESNLKRCATLLNPAYASLPDDKVHTTFCENFELNRGAYEAYSDIFDNTCVDMPGE